jgi:hypothetical protein
MLNASGSSDITWINPTMPPPWLSGTTITERVGSPTTTSGSTRGSSSVSVQKADSLFWNAQPESVPSTLTRWPGLAFVKPLPAPSTSWSPSIRMISAAPARVTCCVRLQIRSITDWRSSSAAATSRCVSMMSPNRVAFARKFSSARWRAASRRVTRVSWPASCAWRSPEGDIPETDRPSRLPRCPCSGFSVVLRTLLGGDRRAADPLS